MGRSAGDLEGVFEFDGETGYFYLHKISGEPDRKIISAIHIISGAPDFNEDDITIRLSADERMVGLFVRSELWAAAKPEQNMVAIARHRRSQLFPRKLSQYSNVDVRNNCH
jgi:hypothetical protein